MITAHRLPELMFGALAVGEEGPDAIRSLYEAQRSKHLMLLTAINGTAHSADPDDPGVATFRAGYQLLARIQAAAPPSFNWLLSLPHLGGWVHDCLIRLQREVPPDFSHFACLAAAAAIRGGIAFELDLPVCDNRILFPGLGSLRLINRSQWIGLSCDGERVMVDGCLEASRRDLVPDDGSPKPVSQWSGTSLIRAIADGLAWDVLLETGDRYLDRYTLPMSAGLTTRNIDPWRRRVQSAWKILVRHHRRAAESITAGVSVIVPLTAGHDKDLVSATTPAAFGAIATSWPPDPVTMAETLVHEFQHVKLGALMDMVPLAESGSEKVYAPWRQDPRPVGGLLQGAYAHLGIARFWNAQRDVEKDPDGVLRAQVMFARWQPAVDVAAHTLLKTGCLTPAGVRFVETLRDEGRRLGSRPVPGDAQEIAEEVALDHWLTWQMKHVAFEPASVVRLAAAYQRGDPCQRSMPKAQIQEEVRNIESPALSNLLNLRYQDPARYRELRRDGFPPLDEADLLLVNRKGKAAVEAYRSQIVGSADPQPRAWIGLALALHQLASSPWREAFNTHLVLMFDISRHLRNRRDPLDLAKWLR